MYIKDTVLVSLGCYNKVPEAGCLSNRNLFLAVVEAKSKIQVPATQVPGERSLSSHHTGRRERALWSFVFFRFKMLFIEWLNYLLKPVHIKFPLPNEKRLFLHPHNNLCPYRHGLRTPDPLICSEQPADSWRQKSVKRCCLVCSAWCWTTGLTAPNRVLWVAAVTKGFSPSKRLFQNKQFNATVILG